MNIKGKKLLVLGGNAATAPLVTAAKDMGVYTYVADKVPDNTAKRFADRAVDIDAMDVDALAEFVKQEKIDGITIGTSELVLPYYADLCERVGLPCYGTKEQFEILSNKVNFKNACRKYGVQVTPEFSITDENLETEGRNLPFPVIVKPEDGNSTRGVTICNNFEELKNAIAYAKESCLSQNFFIEKYFDVEKDSYAINIYYTVVNGEAKLTLISDAQIYMYETKDLGLSSDIIEGKVKPESVALTPSKFTKLFLEKVHPTVQALIDGLGVKNGPVFFQGMVQNDEIYLFESGFRLNGAIEFLATKGIYNVSSADMLVNFALTGDITNNCKAKNINPLFGKTFGWYSLGLTDGTIATIEGIDKVKEFIPELCDIYYNKKVGDRLYNTFGTYQQTGIVFYQWFDSVERMCECINYVYDNVKVINTDGNNMVIKKFNSDYCVRYFNENRYYQIKYSEK